MLYCVQNMRDGPQQNNQGSDLPPRAKSAERKYTMSSRNKPARFTVDFVNKKIIGTKASLSKAKNYGSDEYNELCELTEAHPRFKVVAKKIERKASKHTYKALNFTFIEKYISIQHNADTLYQEYEQVKETAAILGRSVYPYTKSWFLKKFSNMDKPFDMDEADKKIKSAAAQSGAVA